MSNDDEVEWSGFRLAANEGKVSGWASTRKDLKTPSEVTVGTTVAVLNRVYGDRLLLEALYITGHSLGAAMASLMAVMLVTDQACASIAAKLRAVYTYGQPMIGSPSFAEACEESPFLSTRVFRYNYRRDVVPALPPGASGPSAHFGSELHYDKAWPWKPRPSTGQMGNMVGLVEVPVAFLGRRLRMFRDVPFRYSIDDHGPQHYISALTPDGIRSEFGS